MSRAAAELVQAFAKAVSLGDSRALVAFLNENVTAEFEVAGRFVGRRAVIDFWRRLFQTYAVIDLQVAKLATEGDLVLAELSYQLKSRRGPATSVRTISVFEVRENLILTWVDHADMTEVPAKERDLWRRLGSARW